MARKIIEMPNELLEKIKELAKINHRSANAEIIHAIEFYLNNSAEVNREEKKKKQTSK